MPRILQIGCGNWGQYILRDLRALGCDVTVAGPPEVGSGLESLPTCDGIVIATPTSTHAEVIACALRRNVPIFVEKPLVTDAATARAIAEQAQGRLFVMDKWRYHPGIEALRQIGESGELGAPLGMHLRQIGWGIAQRDVDVAWVLLPHCLSIILEVLGAIPDPIHAFAESLRDHAVTLTGSLGRAPWAAFEVSARSPIKRREFSLHCEDGVAWLDDAWSDHVAIARAAGHRGADAEDVERRPVSTELPLLRELRAFLGHLAGGPPPRSSAAEAALIVERIQQLRTLAGLP